MKRYSITWKGVVTVFAVPLAVIAVVVTVTVMALRSGPAPDSGLSDVSPNVTASASPLPPPSAQSPSPQTSPSATVSAPVSPSPSVSPSPQPSPSPPVSPSPKVSSSPIPIGPSPSASLAPSPSPSLTPTPPADDTPVWAKATAAVMFGYDSALPDDAALAKTDLEALLPPSDELADWIIVCEGFSASDETAENLGLKRAEAVASILTEALGIGQELVRVKGAPAGSGNQRYRQRVDIYFVRAGHK